MTHTTGVVFKREDCAGFGVRVLVDFIDIVLAILAVVLISFPLLLIIPDDALSQIRAVFFLAVAVWLTYFVFLKYSSRTLGYRLCGVRLVNLQGQPPTLWEVFTRGLFAVIGPGNLFFDLIWLGGDPHRQALRDKFAHTYVVRSGAEPVATGPIGYTTFTIMGSNFTFQEVRALNAEEAR
jgi:uncharacterized RDD family membrane protein YckC